MGRRELARLVGLGRLRLIGPRRGVRYVPLSLCLWLTLPSVPTETPTPSVAMSCNMYTEGMDANRTAKIEEIAARFCGAPLTAETVFLRPAYRHGQFEREVCDLLVAFRGQGIVLSLKSQDAAHHRRGWDQGLISRCSRRD